MTAKESVKYMKQKHYYEHWVKPECGLLDSHSSTDVQKWKDKPVGNNPKYMPLDNNLNNDLHASVLTHCIMTQNLDDNDKMKFDMSTPVQRIKAYTRIWEHHPPSKHIVEDINMTYGSLRDILVTKGALRKGAESHKRMHDRKFSHGGKRKALTDEEQMEKDAKTFIHPDAKKSIAIYQQEAEKKVHKSN